MDSRYNYHKSKAITRDLEEEYNLHKADRKQRQFDKPLRKVDVSQGNVKKQVANKVKSLCVTYKFQSLGEYRALLSLYNISLEEVRGEVGGREYHGFVYSATDAQGNKVGNPFKASKIDKSVGVETIEKRFAYSAKKFTHSKSMAQVKTLSPFNTVGDGYGKTKNNDMRKEFADTLDEEANVEDIANPPVDSVKAYIASVSLPLKHIIVNSPFGVRKDPMNKRTKRIHNGLDLKAKFEEVYSMLPGVVTAASYSPNGGYYVTVNHGACVCSYLHLSKILVKVGQRIKAGHTIAVSGNSGRRTTGPHLHISCRWKNESGKFFNPMLILRFVTEQLLKR